MSKYIGATVSGKGLVVTQRDEGSSPIAPPIKIMTHYIRTKNNTTIVDLEEGKNDFHTAINIENYSKGLLLLPDNSLKQEFIKDFSYLSELRGVWFEVIEPNNPDKTMREFIKASFNFVCERWDLCYITD